MQAGGQTTDMAADNDVFANGCRFFLCSYDGNVMCGTDRVDN